MSDLPTRTPGNDTDDCADEEFWDDTADEGLEDQWAATSDAHDDQDVQSGGPSGDTFPRASTVQKQLLERLGNSDIVYSYNDLLTMATQGYLTCVDPSDPPTPQQVERSLLAMSNMLLDASNVRAKSAAKGGGPSAPVFLLLQTLTAWQVAQVLLHIHRVVRVAPSDKDTDNEYDLLAMYVGNGPQRGLYSTSESEISAVARRYNTSMTIKGFAEIQATLREIAPRRHQCTHRDLIAVNNGIFNYSRSPLTIDTPAGSIDFDAKEIHPFTPDLVFLSKAAVNYVHNAVSPVFIHPEDGTRWEIREWVNELSDDEGVPQLIWEIIGAIIRPHVRWGKTAWFYSESGNNGKGTLCSLMRNLCGPRAHTSIALNEFGKDFALEPLVRANAIIVDENDVGTYIDQAANLKAVVTNDIIQINRKYRMPVAFQFFGFMVQCLNEFPRVKDKSESFYRRQLFVPFKKSFTGAERRYIKDDYLQRPEVLEYALWYVLHEAGSDDPGNYYELSQPQVTKDVLLEYKETNDPVRFFWSEFRDQYVWSLLPFTFLYDHYRSWFPTVSPSGTPVGRKQFINDLVAVLERDPMWECKDKEAKIRPAQRMAEPELLIHQYKLTDWMNPGFTGDDPLRVSMPRLAPNYRGVTRRDLTAVVNAAAEANEAHESNADAAASDTASTTTDPDSD